MTTLPVITKSMALAYLERAVEEKGREHTMEQCRYFDLETGKPICIVGFVFHYHGYQAQDFAGFNGMLCGMLSGYGFNAMTPAAARVLGEAQRVQDGFADCSWGAALDAAKRSAAIIERE